VVENSRAGVMEALGLGWQTLHVRNARLVYGAIRGFGDQRSGASPYADWPAYDVVAQAMGGAVGMTGSADGQAYKVGPSVGDIYPATLTALGVCAALVHARSTGRGQFVDVAMYDAVLALCEALVYRWSYGGIVTEPAGNGHPMLCPMDLFPTLDGACAIAAPTERHWPLLARLIGRLDLVDDERCRTNRQRVANAAFVREVIGDWTGKRTKAEVAAALGGQVPVGPMHTAPDVFADPHVAARNMLVDVPHPGAAGPMTVVGSPIHLSETPSGIWRRAPILGEHTAELLAEVGLEASSDPSATEPAPRVRL
jgi:crotonobetainyl-CoA:carnitine CoA-transferase CaiB-like acyl-CoA transferase